MPGGVLFACQDVRECISTLHTSQAHQHSCTDPGDLIEEVGIDDRGVQHHDGLFEEAGDFSQIGSFHITQIIIALDSVPVSIFTGIPSNHIDGEFCLAGTLKVFICDFNFIDQDLHAAEEAVKLRQCRISIVDTFTFSAETINPSCRCDRESGIFQTLLYIHHRCGDIAAAGTTGDGINGTCTEKRYLLCLDRERMILILQEDHAICSDRPGVFNVLGKGMFCRRHKAAEHSCDLFC